MARTLRASRDASPMRSPTFGRIHLSKTFQKGMTCLTNVLRQRCLPIPELMTLLLRAPRLQSLVHLLVRTLPWRWMRGLLACLPLAQSPERMTTCSVAMMQWEWRLAWPISRSHPPVDKTGRVRKPPLLRRLPCWKKVNCRSC